MTTPPRSAIARLAPYPLAAQVDPAGPRVLQLGQNELGGRPSPRAVAAVAAAAPALTRYPDADHLALRRVLAERQGLDMARILCGAGSMEIMGWLATAYLEPGSRLLASRTGYKYMATLAAIAGAAVDFAEERDMTADVDALLAAVRPETRLLYLANPNNPTGTCIGRREIERLRAGLPDRVMLLLDAAYGEFVTRADYEAGAALVDGGANVVMLRTFSKAYGLAGLRVGWAYLPEAVANTLVRMRAPNSLSTQALAGAEAALSDPTHLRATVDAVVALREQVRQRAAALGIESLESQGNFLLLRIANTAGRDAAAVYQALLDRHIILRPVASYEGLGDYLRLTLGTAEEMDLVFTALEEILS